MFVLRTKQPFLVSLSAVWQIYGSVVETHACAHWGLFPDSTLTVSFALPISLEIERCFDEENM